MLEIKKNNQTIELRNLQEQVQKNKEDIANHYAIDRAMANLGIKVVGQVSTPQELPGITNFPEASNYQGEYGDTYAVGNKEAVDAGNASYDYWVFTRPDPNAGYTENYWLNVGRISIAGPVGPVGPKGEKGDTGASTRWYTGEFKPANPNIGDMYLNRTGMVFQFTENDWISIESIIGPQGVEGPRGKDGPPGPAGPQGIQGLRGPAGGFTIAGILSQPPTEDPSLAPEVINNLTIAYLVGSTEPYDLWIQIGINAETAEWSNQGPVSGGTVVLSNGVFQNTWDADTKVDKITTKGQSRLYSVDRQGNQGYKQIYDTPDLGSMIQLIPMYYDKTNNQNYGNKLVDSKGVLLTNEPNQPYQAANKRYVDNKFLEKDTSTTDYNQVYVKAANGGQGTINVTKQLVADAIPQRQSDGNIYVPVTPVENTDAASKAYVDNKVKTYRHHIEGTLRDERNKSTDFSMVLYTTSPDLIITPDDTAESTIASFANKYLQPGAMFLATTLENSVVQNIPTMSVQVTNNALSCSTGRTFNFSTALRFVDYVVEC